MLQEDYSNLTERERWMLHDMHIISGYTEPDSWLGQTVKRKIRELEQARDMQDPDVQRALSVHPEQREAMESRQAEDYGTTFREFVGMSRAAKRAWFYQMDRLTRQEA